MENCVYIEDVTSKELKKMILGNDELKFKHRDCSMVFSSEGEHLYAGDINLPESDVFGDGNFVGAIVGYYDTTSPVVELLEDLASVGLELELADLFCTFNMPVSELRIYS